jgi:hypothetical protein
MAKTAKPAHGGAGEDTERNLQERELRGSKALPFGAGEACDGRRAVLLRPNQTSRVALMGSTTSPQLIRALIAECFDCGARRCGGGRPACPEFRL